MDIKKINTFETEIVYDFTPEMIAKMCEFHKMEIKISDVKNYVKKNACNLRKYVYLKENVDDTEKRRLKNSGGKVEKALKFVEFTKLAFAERKVTTKLSIISCLQVICLDKESEIFDYVFAGYEEYLNNKPRFQPAVWEGNNAVSALKTYWVRRVTDHWYANIGRHQTRTALRELENAIDDMLIHIYSCSTINEMKCISEKCYSAINQRIHFDGSPKDSIDQNEE